ncbi:MAG: CaiB/BaiF CoA-transferase family protein [Granulosicoccus sp.]
MTNTLEGLLVVSIEQAVAAPLCTARLVDAGARVIKVERTSGDFARQYDKAAKGDSSYFAWTNAGKESIVLDFHASDDAALLHRMISQADVLVQNLAPGALIRAGFDPNTLRSENTSLITCSISGYGNSDARANMKAYDLLIQAESGLVSISGGPGEPGRIGISLCDIGAGITAYSGILEALLKRAAGGKGSAVEVSLFDVISEWMTVPLVHTETGRGAPERAGLKHPSIAPYGEYTDAQGILTLLSIQNEREWQRLCEEVLNAPALAVDPRFRENTTRVKYRVELDQDINKITQTLTTDTFRRALARASIAYGALNTVDDLSVHTALRRRTILTVAGEQLSLPAHPVRLSDQETGPGKRIPALDQHGEAIRREFHA